MRLSSIETRETGTPHVWSICFALLLQSGSPLPFASLVISGTHERVFFQLAPGCQKHAFGNLFGIVTECQRAVLDLQIARVRVY